MINKEDILIECIERLDNYEDASKALSKLMYINPLMAKVIAKQILENKRGDVFFRASAFDTLYALDINEAYRYTCDFIDSIEIYLLGVIIGNVTSDSSLLKENKTIELFVDLLKQHLSVLSPSDLYEIKEDLDWFRETYL